MEDINLLELEEQLLELQIRKAKLLSKPSPASSSTLPPTATWGKSKGTNYVSLGTIPRSNVNQAFPAKASEFIQQASTTGERSELAGNKQVVTLPKSQRSELAGNKQAVALPKSKKSELTENKQVVALPKSKETNTRSQNQKKKDSSNRKKSLPTEPRQKNKVLDLEPASSDPFSFQKNQNKKWKPSSKRPLNPDSLTLINSIFQYCPDISLMRKLEKSLYFSTKITIPNNQDTSLATIPAVMECDFQVNQLEQVISTNDFQNMVYPTFWFNYQWWTKLFCQIKENQFDSYFSDKTGYEINKTLDSRSLVSINKPDSCSPDFLWTIMNYGFLSDISFSNTKCFKNCPKIIQQFASHSVLKNRSRWMVISTSPTYQFTNGEHTVRFWTNPENQPEVIPGKLILVEDPQSLFSKTRPFNRGISFPGITEEDQFHLAGVFETDKFLEEIEDNFGFKIHSQEGRIICYQLHDNNLPHEDFVKNIQRQHQAHKHLVTWKDNDEESGNVFHKEDDIIAGSNNTQSSGPSHKEKESLNVKESKDSQASTTGQMIKET
jgi:hypothetical protein